MSFKRSFIFVWGIFLLLLQASVFPLLDLRVGVYQNPPLSLIDAHGTPDGFVIELINEIANKYDWEVQYIPCDWEECLVMLEAGEIDLLGPIAYADERVKHFDFSEETLLTNWGQVYAKSGATNLSILDLDGQKVGVLEGDIHAEEIKSVLAQFSIDAEFLYYDDYETVMQAIEDGAVFAGVVNHLFALQYAHQYQVEQSAIIFNPIEVRFAAPKGGGGELLSILDEEIHRWKADPDSFYYRALNQWVVKDIQRLSLPTWVWWVNGVILFFLAWFVAGIYWLRQALKRQTAAQEQSKEELTLILDHIPSMVSYLDDELRYIYVDQSYAAWYGFDKEEVIGKKVEEILPPSNYEKVLPRLLEVVREGEVVSYQHHVTRHTGAEADVAITYIPYRDEQGKVTTFFAAVRDITEQVKARNALAESEAQYRLLVDNSLVGIYIIQDGVLRFANQGLVEIFGYASTTEMTGIAVKQLIASYDWEKVQHEMQVKESGKRESSHFRFDGLRADGSVFNAEVRSHVISYGGNKAIQGVLTDVTEVIAVEERFRALSEASFEAIFISEKGICLEQNLAAERMFGYSLEEAVGKISTDWIVLDDRDMVMYHILTGHEEPYRATALRKDGSTFPAAIHGRMMHYKGRVVRVTSLRDITEEVRTEEQLTATKERFEKVIAQAPVSMVITDANGDIEYYNEEFMETFGYTLEDAQTAEEWWQTAYPDEKYRAKVQESWESAITKAAEKGEKIPTQIWEMVAKDGTTRTVEFDMMPLGEIAVVTMNDITARVKMEETLRESEKKFRDLFEKSQDANMIIINSVFVGFNQAALDMLGYEDKDALLGVHPGKLSPPRQPDGRDSMEKAEEMMQIAFEEGSHRFIWNHQRANGEVFPVEVLLTAIAVDEDERVLHTTWKDITNRVQTERMIQTRLALAEFALSHSLEEVLQKTLDETEKLTKSKIGFYHFLDEDQNALSLQAWSNKTLASYCAVEEGFDRHYPVDEAGVWVECIRTRQPAIHNDYASMENKRGLPEGHAEVIRELVVPVIRNEKIVAILGVGNKATNYDKNDVEIVSVLADLCWEVAERKIAEEVLEESEERLRKLINSTPDIICFKDGEGRWLTANNADLQLFELEGVDYVGKTDRELAEYSEFYHDAFLACEETDEIAWQADGISRGDEIIPTPDGGNKVYDVIKAPIFADDGKREGLVVLGRDISKQVHFQEALQAHTQQLEMLNNIAIALTSSLELENLFDIIFREVAKLIHFDSAAIFFVENEGQVKIVKAVGFSARYQGARVSVTGSLMQGIGESRHALIIKDAHQSHYYHDWGDVAKFHGWMGVPLYVKDVLVGYLTFDSKTPDVFTNRDASLAESISPHIAQALYNARLHNERKKSLQQIETLNRITVALSESLELDELLALILSQVALILPLDSASIFLYVEEGLEVMALYGLDPAFKGTVFKEETPLFNEIKKLGKPLIVNTIQEDPRFMTWKVADQPIQNWMGVPLIVRKEIIGFMNLDSHDKALFYTEEHAQLALTFASQAAQAINNARLYARVTRDANHLEKMVQERTKELQEFVALTAGREIRMAELKEVISRLRTQLVDAGQVPVADDPLKSGKSVLLSPEDEGDV